MDVKGINFRSHLSSILAFISKAHFVSFDLELSGIPGRQRGQPKAPGEPASGKPTLQERYEETKRAAERYQILQFGMTCVEEDRERGVYILRPYNFFVNPLPDKKLDVEREFTYQSGAVEFLLGYGFRMDAPFKEGVPYFSREEEARARATAAYRRDKNNYTEIRIEAADIESIGFLDRVKEEVRLWMNRGMPGGFLNIAPVNHSSSPYARGLNGFQKRLVHQLIRSEFPGIVSLSKNDFIQLLPYDQKREDAQADRKTLWFERSLASQIGLRWIAEALCPTVDDVLATQHVPPCALSSLTAVREWSQPPVPMTDEDCKARDTKFDELLMQLKRKLTVLVGHNVFLDLIYFYTCFFGPLPDRVEDFQHIMKHLFPMVFDTKYLADKINNNSPSYNSSLEDLDRELSKLPLPVIEIPPEYSKYASDSPIHEAGFDSFLTAKILIRLAARIEAETQGDQSPPSEDDIYVTAPEHSSSVPLTGDITSANGYHAEQSISPLFFHNNPYAMLEHLKLDNDDNHRLDDNVPTTSPSRSRKETHRMMPDGDSSFWQRYGNKLRVNGTLEEFCVIW